MSFINAPFIRFNRIAAWLVFGISFFLYALTIEPTTSFWDCGEYISCAYGLEIGHPPGAPLFLLFGRIAALFSFGNRELVASCINLLSALASAFTVFFLHLTITAIARKILLKTDEANTRRTILTIIAAGIIGSLSFAFSDTFWFSAVEGEVYALSSLFTAIVVWAMLRWEEVADDPGADRWLVFIAYMIGLSIGVHLLNLLAIPALVILWFFRRKKELTRLGILLAVLVAVGLLGGVQNMIIPGIVSLCARMEFWFVNGLGFSFNSGTIIYFLILAISIIAGIALTHHFRKRVLNTALMAFTGLLIGYSSFFILIIRAQTSPPINENNTSNAINLLAYLNREQYGDWPLLYGQNYNTPLDAKHPYLDGEPVYVRDQNSGQYIVSDSRRQTIPNYDKRGCRWFPRMWNAGHASSYKIWGDVSGKPIDFSEKQDSSSIVNIPTTKENLRFMVSYQTWWMYLRYLLWNFAGRQNDRLGYGGSLDGNVATGISFLDRQWLGNQQLMPDSQSNNKARNHYFAIPLLLGFLGFYWLFKASPRYGWVVLLLFVFTGLAIVFYLNTTPGQPRERDYAFVGSFYAFAIWIGFGVFALIDLIIGFGVRAGRTATLIGLLLAISSPFILVQQNFDDHNRSGRTAARDFAVNLLNSCAPNSILFTYADNDTFTLWFAQEVLGIRRDVRVVCLSLLRSDWYIDQMKRRQYTSESLPITLSHWDYREGTRDYVSIDAESDKVFSADSLIRFAISKNSKNTYINSFGDTLNYFPSRHAFLPINQVAIQKQNFNSFDKNLLNDTLFWDLPGGSYMLKDQLIILDILAHHNWERPIYFAANMPGSAYAGLTNYLQLEGLAFRLVPFRNPVSSALNDHPLCNTQYSFQLLTQQFGWGGLEKENVYADETVYRMFIDPMRQTTALVASALAEQGQSKKAIDLIRLCMNKIPIRQAPPDEHILRFTELAWEIGEFAFAKELTLIQFQEYEKSISWLKTLPKLPGDYYLIIEKMDLLYQLALQGEEYLFADELKKRSKRVGVDLRQKEGTHDSNGSDSTQLFNLKK